jgi:ribosomal protein S18 acetylase RimI-like enzyme
MADAGVRDGELALDPEAFGRWTVAATADLAPGPVDALTLRPDHPFLATGRWRAFVVDGAGGRARVVAGLDPRQVDAAGRPVGTIGFAAGDGPGKLGSVLDRAVAWLAAEGAGVIRSPIQLATTYGHRLPLDADPGPPLPLERSVPADLRGVLEDRGFAVAHVADSYLIEIDAARRETMPAAERVAAEGCTTRPLRTAAIDGELAILHRIAMAAFRRSWAFSPVSLAEFAAIYRPLMGLVDPELVLVAEDRAGTAVGFVFAFAAADTLVVKSIAVDPAARRTTPGIGWLLMDRVYAAAAARGLRGALHALMADRSYTARISARWGTRVRRHGTLERAAGPGSGRPGAS